MTTTNTNYTDLLPHFCSSACADRAYYADKFYGEWVCSHDRCDECGNTPLPPQDGVTN